MEFLNCVNVKKGRMGTLAFYLLQTFVFFLITEVLVPEARMMKRKMGDDK